MKSTYSDFTNTYSSSTLVNRVTNLEIWNISSGGNYYEQK